MAAAPDAHVPILARLVKAATAPKRASAHPPAGVAQALRALSWKTGFGVLSDRALRRRIDLPVQAVSVRMEDIEAIRANARAILTSGGADALFRQIALWDQARARTAHGDRMARLGAEVALDMMINPTSQQGPGLAAFEDHLARTPDDPVAAALAAMAHLCIARPEGLPVPALQRDHLGRAEDILEPFEPAAHGSTLVAEARYRLQAAIPPQLTRIREAHDDWADLDPTDPVVWATHGATLLAGGFATPSEVVASALRAEWQTSRWLGRGGYALALLPALEGSAGIMPRLDPEHLVAAVLDLARHHRADKHEVNLLAARLARLASMAPPESRRLFQTVYRQVLEDSLNTLIPSAWGCAEISARRAIAHAFLPELRAGARLRATAAGLRLCDPSAA